MDIKEFMVTLGFTFQEAKEIVEIMRGNNPSLETLSDFVREWDLNWWRAADWKEIEEQLYDELLDRAKTEEELEEMVKHWIESWDNIYVLSSGLMVIC